MGGPHTCEARLNLGVEPSGADGHVFETGEELEVLTAGEPLPENVVLGAHADAGGRWREELRRQRQRDTSRWTSTPASATFAQTSVSICSSRVLKEMQLVPQSATIKLLFAWPKVEGAQD